MSRLIFHLGAAHSFIRQKDRGVCGGSAELLHYSLKTGEIGPRRRILNPRPPSPPTHTPPCYCRGMMCVQQDLSSCSLYRHDHNSPEGAGYMLREQQIRRQRHAEAVKSPLPRGEGKKLTEMLIAEEDGAPFCNNA